MINHHMLILLALLMLSTGCSSTQSPQMLPEAVPDDTSTAVSLVGYWEGHLDIGQSTRLTIGFSFSEAASDGSVVTLLQIPQQGVRDMEVSGTFEPDNSITIEMPDLRASYTGKYDDANKEFNGVFSQMGQQMPLVLSKSIQKEDRKRQDPVPPYPYIAQDVHFTQQVEGFSLAGTVTRPDGEGPFPAVVLISGSGSQNRDEELFGHRPFLVLADTLTRAGLVVLRYDDRGFAESEGDATAATTFELANDAESAVTYLKTLPFVERSSIGLIGHSEGAIIAPIVAQRNPDIAFIVMMAGSGYDGITTLEDQTAAIMRAQGADEAAITQMVALNSAVYHTIIDESLSIEERKESVHRTLATLGMPESSIEAQMEALFSPWYVRFLSLDPSKHLRAVTVPVMVLNGEKDTQVSAALHVPAIETALREGGNMRVTTRVYKNLNHLFQPAITGGVEEYGSIQTTIDQQVLDDITYWILEGRNQL